MKEKATPEPGIKPCPFCGSVGKLEEVESEDGYRFDVYVQTFSIVAAQPLTADRPPKR
jgi:hypothetical protein